MDGLRRGQPGQPGQATELEMVDADSVGPTRPGVAPLLLRDWEAGERREEMTHAPVHWALSYAEELGWPVFPIWEVDENGVCACPDGEKCKSPGKHPRTQHGFKDASDLVEDIERWWEVWPEANIGIRTGEVSAVFIDFDDETQLAVFEAAHGAFTGPLARTGGGGWHAGFAHPGIPVPSRQGIVPGVDVRADSGYIVAAPSSHASGNVYAWVRGPETPLQAIPDSLLELLAGSSDAPLQERHEPAGPTVELAGPPVEGDLAEVASALAVIPAVERQIWLEVGMALHSTRDPGARALWDEWSRTCPEKFDAADQEKTWRAFRPRSNDIGIKTLYHLAYQHGWAGWQRPEALNGTAVPAVVPGDPARGKRETAPLRLPFRTIAELRALAAERFEDWLVFGLVGLGVFTLIGAKPKAGKTTFLAALLAAVERALEFAGFATTKATAVVLSEEPAKLLADRCDRFGVERAVFLCREDFDPRLSFGDFVRAGVEECQQRGATILLIDTYARFARLGADGEKDAGRTQEVLEAVLEATAKGIAVILVTHIKKGDGDEGEAIRGSTALTGVADIVIELRRGGGDDACRELTFYSRFQETPADRAVVRLNVDRFERVDQPKKAAQHNDLRGKILGYLAGREDWVERDEVLVAVPGRVTKKRRALDDLIDSGVVEETGTGRKGSPCRNRLAPIPDPRPIPVPGPDGNLRSDSRPSSPLKGDGESGPASGDPDTHDATLVVERMAQETDLLPGAEAGDGETTAKKPRRRRTKPKSKPAQPAEGGPEPAPDEAGR